MPSIGDPCEVFGTRSEATIRWSLRDEFWRRQILSADNLRKHWDKLVAQQRKAPARQGPTAAGLDRVRMLEEQEARAAVAKPES